MFFIQAVFFIQFIYFKIKLDSILFLCMKDVFLSV